MGIFSLGDPSFDIDDAKIFTNDGAGNLGPLIDVPGISVFATNFRTRSAEGRGDGRIVAVASKVEAIEVTIKNLSIPGNMAEIFFGITMESSGITTARISEFYVGSKFFPFFGIAARSFAGESVAGKMLFLPYIKIMDAFEWRFEENNFTTPEIKALALEDPTLVDDHGNSFILHVKNYATLPAVHAPL